MNKKLIINGIEQAIADMQIDARLAIGSTVEIPDLTVTATLAAPPAEPPPVEPETPPEPETPEDPETPAEPETPADPETPTEPDTPVETDEPGVIARNLANVRPGEWLNIADQTTWPGKDTGISFKEFLQIRGVGDGMGWTQRITYYKGQLAGILVRTFGDQAVFIMRPDGEFYRVDNPELYNAYEYGGDRRPFNKLTQDDEFLYFFPPGKNELAADGNGRLDTGFALKSPLTDPARFQRVGPSFRSDQMGGTGNFSTLAVPEWGRVYGYTPGGRIFSCEIRDDAEQWIEHARLPRDMNNLRLTGYAGNLVWNPIKQELLIMGGQDFGTTPRSAFKIYKITEPLGNAQMLADLRFPNGDLMEWESGGSKCLVHPDDGSYLFYRQDPNIPRVEDFGLVIDADGIPEDMVAEEDRQRCWYRSYSGGGTTEKFHSLYDHGLPWGPYEAYVAFFWIPDTRIYLCLSHIRGLMLWEPPSTANFRDTPEDDPILLPEVVPGEDPPLPPPSADASFAEMAAAVSPGGMAPIQNASVAPHASFADYWMHDCYESDRDQYGGRAVWDEFRGLFICLRDRTPSGPLYPNWVQLKIFDAAQKAWTTADKDSLGAELIGSAHSYSQMGYDPARGRVYYNADESRIVCWHVDHKRWEVFHLTPNGMDIDTRTPSCYHAGLDMLIKPQGEETTPHLMGWKPGASSWTDLGPIGHGPYHDGLQSLLHYNPVRGDALLVGGSSSPANRCRVTLITASGEIIPQPSIPAAPDGFPVMNTNINWAQLAHDPLSGDYLYKAGLYQLWEFSPDLAEQELAVDFMLPEYASIRPGRFYNRVMAPIDSMGVVGWLGYDGPMLYRHKSVFG